MELNVFNYFCPKKVYMHVSVHHKGFLVMVKLLVEEILRNLFSKFIQVQPFSDGSDYK